jgi:hypothetical protein
LISYISIKCIAFYRHGSPDSLDVDLLYQFPSLPEAKDCLNFSKGVAEDRNIFVVEDGISVYFPLVTHFLISLVILFHRSRSGLL